MLTAEDMNLVETWVNPSGFTILCEWLVEKVDSMICLYLNQLQDSFKRKVDRFIAWEETDVSVLTKEGLNLEWLQGDFIRRTTQQKQSPYITFLADYKTSKDLTDV